jgi:hypothetical protein
MIQDDASKFYVQFSDNRRRAAAACDSDDVQYSEQYEVMYVMH